MSCKAVSPSNGKVLEHKRKPIQNIFLKGLDVKGIALPDRAIFPNFEQTKFPLVSIDSYDIATRREGG
jgi:hypothetical protein